MSNEPACHEQSDSQENRDDGEPVFLAPPEREQEADAQDDGGDFAGHDIEAAEDQQHANEGGAQVAGWKGNGLDASAHVRYAAFMWVQRDGFDSPASAAGGGCVREFVEGDDEHLHQQSVN